MSDRRYKHHRYTWSKPFGSPRHWWEIVCSKGAIHFTATFYKDGAPPSCGLEFHSLTGEGAPDHVNCPLTGGRCWHDGTSLYANESVWPLIEGPLRSGDQEVIFSILEMEAHRHFYSDERHES